MHGFESAQHGSHEGAVAKLPERRNHSRRSLLGNAQVLVLGLRPLEVMTLDIGISGISVVAAVDAPPDAECTLRFFLPRGLESMPIETQVVVAHSVFSGPDDGYRVGMGFRKLTDEQVSAIKVYVSSRAGAVA